MRLPSLRRRTDDPASHDLGQSLVELALVVPVLLLIVLTAVDFGRVYLGYVNLQQMARVAGAFAAEHAEALDRAVPDPTVLDRYRKLIVNDASKINCTLPATIDPPAFSLGHDLGDPVEVHIGCQFTVLTPIISHILGGSIPVSASVVYPVKEGAVAEVPGGGGPVVIAPIADFVGTPQSGFGKTTADYGTLDVVFTDLSKNAPTSWQWNFGNGTANTKGPHTVHYVCDRAPGETCAFTVTLTVGSAGGFSTETKTSYITVTVPPDSGPIAEFTATPRTGVAPLNNVQFSFVSKTTGVTYTTYEWDFDGNGTWDATGQTATHSYANPGAYTVSLRVTDSGGNQNVQTKVAYILVTKKICTVPDFANVRRNSAQSLWAAAGFTTSVQFASGSGNYLIHTQSITGGTIDPQPDGCGSAITVGP